MNATSEDQYTAFIDDRLLAAGGLLDVCLKAREVLERNALEGQIGGAVLVFNNATSRLMDVDLRGSPADVLTRLNVLQGQEQPRGPGRPKLGVVAREVTLLPRHWDWLRDQPGGASVALRKLVETARRLNDGKDRVREAQDSTYRFISAMAGDRPGFEEAARALFAGQRSGFEQCTDCWPEGIRDHARALAAAAFP